jgi:predicted AlkP superfamily phosphohydrolase/phosphomutase
MGLLDSLRAGFRTRPDRDRSRKLLVLGIDGAPHGLIQHLADTGDMPCMSDLRKRGTLMRMRSSMPPISSVAWTTFLTGVNSGKHGIYGFLERKPDSYDIYFPNAQHIKSPTVWEILEKHGKRCVVMNVPNTYPARAMQGVLISGFVAIDLKRAVYPASLLPRLQAMDYRIDVDYRRAAEEKDKFFQDLFHTLERRREAMLYLLREEPWDLFVGVFTESDRLHHYCWDEFENPEGRYHERFVRFYRRLDEIIGEILTIVGDEVELIMLSDHGFGPLQAEVNVNTWLREHGYLKLRKDPSDSLTDIDVGSTAFCLDPGRIYLNLRGRMPNGCVEAGKESEALLQRLMDELGGLTVPSPDGKEERVIERIFRKEELYRGPYSTMAPDCVLHSRRGFDLKGALNRADVLTKSKFTGMHTYDDAFLYTRADRDLSGDVQIVDVLPTMLAAMNIPIPVELDGSAVSLARCG